LPQPPETRGHAIQARWYAEDPARDFVPSPGRIHVLEFPPTGVRIDAGYAAGDDVPSAYDPLIAKVIAYGPDRPAAIERLRQVLEGVRIAGIATNRPWLLEIVRDERFRAGRHDLTLAEAVRVPDGPPPLEAFAALLAADARPARDAWDAVGPFRLVGAAVRAFHGAEAGGWEARLRVRPGRNAPLVAAADGEEWLAAGAAPGVVALPVGDGWELSAPMGRWLVSPGPRPREHARDRAIDGVVRAPMPGTVAAVHVSVGQRVGRDEVVAVMLAMKIEIALAAPASGVVSAVGAAPGDLVGSRQMLVTIQPDPGEEGERGAA
jgi:acetyl/propionyl-CoA carboxylase alpha subunit